MPEPAEASSDTPRYLVQVGSFSSEKNANALASQLRADNLPVLMDVERAGVKLDIKLLAKQSAELQERLDVIIHDIETLAGHEFNINSTQQLQKVLILII